MINKELIINPEWEHAQFVSIAELKECEQKLEAAYDRIKQLEEAGDYLCAAAAFMGWHDKIETWNKAKEAK